MDDIYTVAELIEELEEMPRDSLVMVATCKYPGEFSIRTDAEGNHRWDLSTDVEVHPLEKGDVTFQQGQCWVTTELQEYDSERAQLNGASAETT